MSQGTGVAMQWQWVPSGSCHPPGGQCPMSSSLQEWGAINSAKYPRAGGAAHRTPHPGPTHDSPPSQLFPVGVRASIPVPHLHDKLPCIGPGHRGALSCCEDPNGPDVQCHRPEIASQDDALCRDTSMGTTKHSSAWAPHQLPAFQQGHGSPQPQGSMAGRAMSPKWVRMPAGHNPGPLTPW